MWLKIQDSNFRGKTANERQNSFEQLNVAERNKDSAIPSPAALWIFSFCEILFLFIYLIRYLKSIFTIVKKLIYIDNKKPNKIKKFKLIKWVGTGRYMSNSNKYQYIPNWTCVSLLGETHKYIYIYKLKNLWWIPS